MSAMQVGPGGALVAEPAIRASVRRTVLSAVDLSWWACGLTLAERCALPDGPDEPAGAERAARAERRLSRWREASWPGGIDQFARRLAQAELDETGLLALLAEEPARLAGRAEQPDWANRVAAMLAEMPAEPALPAVPPDAAAAAGAGLAAIVAPFTGLAVGRFGTAVHAEGLGAGVDLEAVRGSLAAGLERTLVLLAGRTLVLELNVLRVAGRLTGDTPRQRFWSFVRHFTRADGLAALLAEYPVLARLLVQAADRAAVAWVEMLRRLAADRALIVDTVFGGGDPGRLVEATFRGRYPGPRSVALLRFAGGARLVHRSRPVGVYTSFNETVDWLNRRLPGLGLRTPTVLDRGGYGWLEFVEHRPRHDPADEQRHLRRRGALLALLYALDGAGLQDEDVIVAGDQPVLVDLDGLFQPTSSVSWRAATDTDPAQAALAASVLRAGLLPTPARYDDDAGGGERDQVPVYPTVTWVAPGTDEMRLVRTRPAAAAGRLRARPAGDPAGIRGEAALLAGFRAAYDAITAGREELVGNGGLLWRFADAELPLPVHTRHTCSELLAESTHPDLMRDALDRDRILGLLPATSLGVARRELAVEVVAALRTGAVPDLSTRPGSRDVWTGDGVPLRDVLDRTAVAGAADKIRAMGPRDRAAQEWIIRASLAGAANRAAAAPAPAGPTTADDIDPQRCLAAARRIADRLAETAYQQGERVSWLGLTSADETQWTVRPLGVGLADGYPGVALFLAKVAELTGDERYATLARGALAHLPSMLESTDALVGARSREAPRSGPFHGTTGLAYAVVQVAASLRDATLLDWLTPLVASAMTVTSDEPDLTGVAGRLAAMLAVHTATDSPPARRIAELSARWLGRRPEQQQEHGPAWHTGLVGFSRGASGIGWALLRYTAATGDRQYADTGLAAFRYERERYRSDPGAWAGRGWCHGAPGIGLARADSRHTGDPEVAQDLDLAVRAVVSAGPVADHSLCHGELAALELLTAAIESGRADLAADRRRRAAGLLDAVERSGPRCGTPGTAATPGLLTGLAGIGYGLLRLVFPDRVPSVLLLEPPRSRPW